MDLQSKKCSGVNIVTANLRILRRIDIGNVNFCRIKISSFGHSSGVYCHR